MKVKDIHRDSGYWAGVFSQAPAPTSDTHEFIHDRLTSELRSEFPGEVSYNECGDPPVVPGSLHHLTPCRSADVEPVHPHITRIDQVGQVAEGHHAKHRQGQANGTHDGWQSSAGGYRTWSNLTKLGKQVSRGGRATIIHLNLIESIEQRKAGLPIRTLNERAGLALEL